MRRNRQRIRKIPLKSLISEGFWSEWGDSNARSLEPKSSAIPTSLHPDIHFSAMIPRRAVKIKFFLSVVIYVVKAAFVPFSATGGKPAIARAARLCGLLSKPRMDRVYALPKQARYQLRYTRIWNDLMGMDPPEATRGRALRTIPVHYNTPAAKREAYSYPFFFGRGLICTWTGWIN